MDCCGHFHDAAPQPWLAAAPLIPIPAMLAGEGGPAGSTAAARAVDNTSAARDVLRRHITVDVHSHGGRTGITSKAPPSGDLATAMLAGSLAAACLADVPDLPVLGRQDGVLACLRKPAAGELYRYHLDRLAWMDRLVAEHGGRRGRRRPPRGRSPPITPRRSPKPAARSASGTSSPASKATWTA